MHHVDAIAIAIAIAVASLQLCSISAGGRTCSPHMSYISVIELTAHPLVQSASHELFLQLATRTYSAHIYTLISQLRQRSMRILFITLPHGPNRKLYTLLIYNGFIRI